MDALFERVAGLDDCEIVSDNALIASHTCSTDELNSHLKATGGLPDSGSALQLLVAEISGTNVHWTGNGSTSAWLKKRLDAI